MGSLLSSGEHSGVDSGERIGAENSKAISINLGPCTGEDSGGFDDLLELIIIEQLKTSVSEQIAMYVNEHKVQSPGEAVSLADDFVLTHRITATVWQTREESEHSLFYKYHFPVWSQFFKQI